MKMKNIYPLLAILLLPPSHATATDHETTKDGVIIRLKQKRPEDVQSIRLQVINENSGLRSEIEGNLSIQRDPFNIIEILFPLAPP